MGKISRKRVHKKSDKKLFDKYELYLKSVQSPENDVEFLEKVYKELKGKAPKTFREDFCGTFVLSQEWIKLNRKYVAHSVDIDPEPLAYGIKKYFDHLNSDQQSRLHIHEKNVLEPGLPEADISVAMNFSYFVFKKREVMKAYFSNCHKSLNTGGIHVIDLFGGSLCQEENEEQTKLKNFTYYWDQASFDPVSHDAKFYIHFKVKGQPKAEKVFSYDWRMWTIPELRDLLLEVGFKKTHVYWEGTTKKGEGDGNFTRTEKGEECQSWIAYIVSEK